MARKRSSKSRRSRSRGRKSAVRSSSRRRTRRTRKTSGRRKHRKHSNKIIVVGRRVSVRKGKILNMNPFKIKSLVNRENLLTAGGVLAASLVTAYVSSALDKNNYSLPLTKIDPKNPNSVTPKLASAGYSLAIPVLGAALTRRFSPALARGMIFGGLANAILGVYGAFNPPKAGVAAQGRYMREYLDPVRSTGAYLAPRAASSVPLRGMGAYTGFNAWA